MAQINLADFRKQSGQTKLNRSTKTSLKFINAEEFTRMDPFQQWFFVARWIKKNFRLVKDAQEKKELLRQRPAEKIIKSGEITGCGDVAIIFLSAIRELGYPAIYIEAARRRWLEHGGEIIEGHVFIEIYFKNNWWIFDPDMGAILGWYNQHIVVARGKDSWDIGVKSFSDLKLKLNNFRKNFIKIRK